MRGLELQMLYSVEMCFHATRTSDAGSISGHHILSLFLRLVESVSPTLAEELHRDSAVKPFTLSPLLPFRRTRQPVRNEGENIAFRITALDERVFATLADAVWRLPPKAELPLGNIHVRCQSLATTPAQSVWADFTSFEQLRENAATDAKLRLDFLSATTFRSKGRRNILFPEPSLVFGSLLNRWNAIAGADHRLELPETVMGLVRTSSYRLATRLLDFGSYQELGFGGQATYGCSDNISAEYVKTLNTLADFAFYAGVGAKTTMGMGQCRRSEDARALSHRTGGDPEKRGRPSRHQQRGTGAEENTGD